MKEPGRGGHIAGPGHGEAEIVLLERIEDSTILYGKSVFPPTPVTAEDQLV